MPSRYLYRQNEETAYTVARDFIFGQTIRAEAIENLSTQRQVLTIMPQIVSYPTTFFWLANAPPADATEEELARQTVPAWRPSPLSPLPMVASIPLPLAVGVDAGAPQAAIDSSFYAAPSYAPVNAYWLPGRQVNFILLPAFEADFFESSDYMTAGGTSPLDTVRLWPSFARSMSRTAATAYGYVTPASLEESIPSELFLPQLFPANAPDNPRASLLAYWRENIPAIAENVDAELQYALQWVTAHAIGMRRAVADAYWHAGIAQIADFIPSELFTPQWWPSSAEAEPRAKMPAYWLRNERIFAEPLDAELQHALLSWPDLARGAQRATTEAYWHPGLAQIPDFGEFEFFLTQWWSDHADAMPRALMPAYWLRNERAPAEVLDAELQHALLSWPDIDRGARRAMMDAYWRFGIGQIPDFGEFELFITQWWPSYAQGKARAQMPAYWTRNERAPAENIDTDLQTALQWVTDHAPGPLLASTEAYWHPGLAQIPDFVPTELFSPQIWPNHAETPSRAVSESYWHANWRTPAEAIGADLQAALQWMTIHAPGALRAAAQAYWRRNVPQIGDFSIDELGRAQALADFARGMARTMLPAYWVRNERAPAENINAELQQGFLAWPDIADAMARTSPESYWLANRLAVPTVFPLELQQAAMSWPSHALGAARTASTAYRYQSLMAFAEALTLPQMGRVLPDIARGMPYAVLHAYDRRNRLVVTDVQPDVPTPGVYQHPTFNAYVEELHRIYWLLWQAWWGITPDRAIALTEPLLTFHAKTRTYIFPAKQREGQ